MAKNQKREISVVTVFDDKKDGQQAFIELILHKRRTDNSAQFPIDSAQPDRYTDGKVFSDVRVG